MGRAEQIDPLANHDWKRTIADGVEMATQQVKRDVVPDERHVIWALLKEAIQTSRLSYSAPPRSGLPTKSQMPESSDDVSYWQMMTAFVRGEIEDAPAMESRPPQPSAIQVDRAEVILQIWHVHALRRMRNWQRQKRAVYLQACGMRPKAIRAITALTEKQLSRARAEAMWDMWEVIRRY